MSEICPYIQPPPAMTLVRRRQILLAAVGSYLRELETMAVEMPGGVPDEAMEEDIPDVREVLEDLNKR